MKYKRERRSKTKSKSSKLDRRKLKKFLKQQGISSLEAMVMLDSSLTSRANGRKYRESRRSESAKHCTNSSGSSKSHDRQSNGRKHTKSRTDRKKRKKSSGKCRESSSHHPHTSKMYNGHRKHSSQSSSSSSPSPSKKNTSDGKKESEASKLIRKMLDNMDSDNAANSSSRAGRSKEAKRQSTSMDYDTGRDSSSSFTTDDKHISSKMFRKYTDSFAQYLLDNMSNISLDSSSDSDTSNAEENQSDHSVEGQRVGYESPTIILLDTDEEEEANANSTESNVPTSVAPTGSSPAESSTADSGSIETKHRSATPTRITPTRSTPTSTTPPRTSSPVSEDNEHHNRVKNIKREKSPRSSSSRVYRKNHRAMLSPHPNQSNERVDSPSSCDDDSDSTVDSDSSSESPRNLISYRNYAYMATSKRRKKLRPPKLIRKSIQRPIPSNERIKSKQTAFEFDVTDVEPPLTKSSNITSPEKRKSPQVTFDMSLEHNDNLHRLALVAYDPFNPLDTRFYQPDEENYEHEEWSNVSEEDDFSDYQPEHGKEDARRNQARNESLDEDFNPEEDDEYVRNGTARADFGDYKSVQIDFDDRPQIIEIEVPVPEPHLLVQSEETIECTDYQRDGSDYSEGQNANASMYPNNYDDVEESHDIDDPDTTPPFENKFPVKIAEPTPDTMNRLTIADIILRMSQQDIDTSVELSKEIVDTEADDVVATTTKHDDGMVADDILSSEPSSVSMDGDHYGSPNGLTENDMQPFVTTSQFVNSTDSRYVLILLKTKIYFHGALSIRLVAGSATIFGYELTQNETVFTYSPRSENFLFLTPSAQDPHQHVHFENNVAIDLNDLPDAFVTSELEEIVSNFDATTDAILLLENDANNKSIYMIENYMRETIFSNSDTFDDDEVHHNHQLSESILRCRFLTHTDSGLTINPQWQDVAMTVNSRQMIIGGKGVGKSTFMRYLINKNLQEFHRILLIDLDIGLPEMFVPQTVSATIIAEPILGPGYIRNASPYKSYLFGDVNVLVSPIKYLKCVLRLLKYCSCRDELQSMPWVINTMGYSHGFGLELIAAILRALNPTDLIQIQSSKSANDVGMILNADVVNGFAFNIFKNEVQFMQNECTYLTYVCNTMCSERQQDDWNRSSRDLRYAMIISKLGSILHGNVNWITDVRPLCAHLSQMKVLVLSDDSDNVHSQSSVLNGNLVYLCTSSEQHADDEIVECFGIGIVRSVETASDKIYLLPAINKTELHHVNVIAICNVPLPPALLLNQSSRIGGRIPYVYSSDNFVGSKKNVPNSCRPEKRMSNHHITLV